MICVLNKCPDCEHANFPFHQIADAVDYVDPNREQAVSCSYEDCECIRCFAIVKRIINTEKEVSANAFRR